LMKFWFLVFVNNETPIESSILMNKFKQYNRKQWIVTIIRSNGTVGLGLTGQSCRWIWLRWVGSVGLTGSNVLGDQTSSQLRQFRAVCQCGDVQRPDICQQVVAAGSNFSLEKHNRR